MQEGIDELKREFSKVDRNDPDQLRQWFEKYSYLTSNDHAQIAGVSARTIRNYKSRAGIKGRGGDKVPQPRVIKQIPIIEVPDNWRENVEWLQTNIYKYGVAPIARLVNRDRNIILKLINRYNIKVNPDIMRSKNPCCTHRWCYKHYIEQKLTQGECAALAGIGVQTFSEWLNRFNIPVRSIITSTNINSPIWIKQTAHKLREHPTTRKVFVRGDHIHVRFMNYYWETYYIGKRDKRRPKASFYVDRDDCKLDYVPKVMFQYESGISKENKHMAHLIINRDELQKASFLERRLAIHEFARIIVTRGWVHPTYPIDVLQQDWNELQSYTKQAHYLNKYYTTFPLNNKMWAGRKLIENFFDPSETWNSISRPRNLITILNTLYNSHLDFTTSNIFRVASMTKYCQAPRLYAPAVYDSIFEDLNITGTILDVTSHFGNRALAAAIRGLKYLTPKCEKFENAINYGLADFVGLDYEYYDNQRVDWVLYDENFGTPDMQKILPFLDKGTNMMVFCPHKDRENVLKYKPKSSIRIKTRWFNKTPDHLFIW